MGHVSRARDRLTGERAALKLLDPSMSQRVDRFLREAQLLADVAYPRIVRFINQGQTPAQEHWLAMEWLEGETLAARLQHGPLSLAETLCLGRGVAEVLTGLPRLEHLRTRKISS